MTDYSDLSQLFRMMNPRRVRIRIEWEPKSSKTLAWMRRNLNIQGYKPSVSEISGDHLSYIFSANLDECPGYLHEEEDWLQLVQDILREQGNVSCQIC